MSEFKKMLDYLDLAWYARNEIVLCLYGPSGIGKTAAVNEHAKTHGSGRVVPIICSRSVPSETVGMTMPNNENHSTQIYNSEQLASLKDGDILFFDELLEADQMVLSTLLTLIQSRQLADGTPLPDIQIVAATNETISSTQLRLNIKQRFMFLEVAWNRQDTYNYVYGKTEIKISDAALDMVTTRGNDYNVLTPRSLTKLYLWMDKIPEEELGWSTKLIGDMWGNISLADALLFDIRTRNERRKDPDYKTKKAIVDFVPPEMARSQRFENCKMNELLEMLTHLPNWEEIKEELSHIDVDVSYDELPDDEDSANDEVMS